MPALVTSSHFQAADRKEEELVGGKQQQLLLEELVCVSEPRECSKHFRSSPGTAPVVTAPVVTAPRPHQGPLSSPADLSWRV